MLHSMLRRREVRQNLLLAAFWPGRSEDTLSPVAGSVSVPEAVQRAVSSILTVCSWVVLAGVAAGFLRRWLFPFLPRRASPLISDVKPILISI